MLAGDDASDETRPSAGIGHAPLTRIAILLLEEMENSMKAARLHAYGQRLVIEDVPTPSPDRGQVLVKVEGAGFCHSDIHVIDGEIRCCPACLSRWATRMPGGLSPWVQESKPSRKAIRWPLRWLGMRDLRSVRDGARTVVRQAAMGRSLRARWRATPNISWWPQDRYLVKLERLKPEEAAPLTDAALTPTERFGRRYRFLKLIITCCSSGSAD